MWDVVFQPFWISGRSGQESFRDTSEKRHLRKSWLIAPLGCCRCSWSRFGYSQAFPLSQQLQGQKENEINNTTSDLDMILAQYVRKNPSQHRRLMDLLCDYLTAWQSDGFHLCWTVVKYHLSSVSTLTRTVCHRRRSQSDLIQTPTQTVLNNIITSCHFSATVATYSTHSFLHLHWTLALDINQEVQNCTM